jgi:hypothetical protein
MENTDALTERQRSPEEGLYTGFSDTQHLPRAEGHNRINGEEIQNTKEGSFTRAPVDKKGQGRAGTVAFKEDKKKDTTKK